MATERARAKATTLLMGGVGLALVAACGGATGSPAPATVGPGSGAPSAAATATAAPASTPGPTSSPAVACAPAPSGVVAWWRAEDDARDAVGGHDGTLEGGAAFGAGKVGRAFTFDGATQFVSVAQSAALQLKTAITIEGWVEANGAQSGYAGIAGTWDDNSGANRTYLLWVLGQSLEFIVSPDHNAYQRASDPTPFPTDVWVHVAATYDGTTVRVYRDGAEVASVAASGEIAVNDKAFLIGRTEGGSVGPNFWKGSIDELTVYDHALSAADVASIHAAGSAGKCRP
jgi:hypothetical protein